MQSINLVAQCIHINFNRLCAFVPEKWQSVLNQQEEFLCCASEQEEEQKDLQQSVSLCWPKLCLSLLLWQQLLANKIIRGISATNFSN